MQWDARMKAGAAPTVPARHRQTHPTDFRSPREGSDGLLAVHDTVAADWGAVTADDVFELDAYIGENVVDDLYGR